MIAVKRHRDQGAVLIVVLLIVMTITVLSLGYLSGSDVELAVGGNMRLHTEMDYLAESALEHAQGLILNPQDISDEFWSGASDQQLVAGSDDYYDVTVTKLSERTYRITADAHRLRGGEDVGRSGLEAELTLDPIIALWVGNKTTFSDQITINGDVYCGGLLTNGSTIDGDVFSASLDGNITGRHMAVGDLTLEWPRVTAGDFTSHYAVDSLGPSISSVNINPSDPDSVIRRGSDLLITGNVTLDAMLIVEGDLYVFGLNNSINSRKNFPALLVTGDLIISDNSELNINGLGVVDGNMKISSNVVDVNVLGSLFVGGTIEEFTIDTSGNERMAVVEGSPVWQTSGGMAGGAVEMDGLDDTVVDYEASSYLNGLSGITVSLWVKSDVVNQDRGIFFTSEPSGNDEELGLRYDIAGATGHGSKGIKASIRTTLGFTQIESSSNVQATVWQHLALVWQSGSGLKLYINGNENLLLYDMGPVGGTVFGVEKFMLGCGTKSGYWDGMIDDVRIYNRALDPNDIYPPVNGLNGLLSRWKLDDRGASATINTAPSRTAIIHWTETGLSKNWISAGDSFFRSIERK
ncbi:MAG: LamG-like jellyroll fold domain-containing protein [Planctomycetota bacterium]|jgi:hypothetical protein